MIGRRYKVHKENVIDIFERYKYKRGDINDGVDIKFLEKRINTLKKGKFIVAVAGEVKAGKSTFINALLGAEILPSDVLQATSAIVEIFKSDSPYLKVKFADGHEEDLYVDTETHDIDRARKQLSEICKIDDRYREIPTTLIDEYIVDSEGSLTLSDDLIKVLEQRSGEHLQDKKGIIKLYISERTLDKIPVQIEFGYPLQWEFDELRIVDTPGVNALGGVQDISFKFLEEANAILFVHPIKPIESQSFRKFVEEVISNRSRETLFLILTHAGLYSNKEVERLHSEAKRLYRDLIPEERILVVDSLLKLIHIDLEKGVPVKVIRKDDRKKKILSSYREQAEEEGRDLKDVILEASRFNEVLSAIDRFSMRAPYMQLEEILEKIKEGYENQETQYSERIELLEMKKRNPQEFADEINRIYKALDEYKLVMNQTVEEIRTRYSGRHSSWQKDIETLKMEYAELIAESDSEESLRKNLTDGLNAVQDKINDFLKELTEKIRAALEITGKEFREEYRISAPKVDLEAIEEEAKASSYKEEIDDVPIILGGVGGAISGLVYALVRGILSGATVAAPVVGFIIGSLIGGGISSDKQVFDPKKYIEEFRVKCQKVFSDTVNELSNKLREISNNYLSLFLRKMKEAISERQEDLKRIRDEKLRNEEIIREIEELSNKKKDIEPEKRRCIEILEDIR